MLGAIIFVYICHKYHALKHTHTHTRTVWFIFSLSLWYFWWNGFLNFNITEYKFHFVVSSFCLEIQDQIDIYKFWCFACHISKMERKARAVVAWDLGKPSTQRNLAKLSQSEARRYLAENSYLSVFWVNTSLVWTGRPLILGSSNHCPGDTLYCSCPLDSLRAV